MRADRGSRWILKWYPASWRNRYGDEMVAFLTDAYGGARVPFRIQLSMIRAGTGERLRSVGLIGDTASPDQRIRAGSLVVLCSWAVFLVAGAGFAKFTEHWDSVTPNGAQWLPSDSYETVLWAAIAGLVVVIVGGALCLPAFFRFLREGGWSSIRVSLLRSILTAAVTAGLTLSLVLWARHLTAQQRNGGLWSYSLLFGAFVLMVIATIATGTATLVAIAVRLEISDRVLRRLGLLAVSLTVVMTAILGGALVWWAAVASGSPWFFGSGVVASHAHVVAPVMVVAGVLMLSGLVAAIAGSGRVVSSFSKQATPS